MNLARSMNCPAPAANHSRTAGTTPISSEHTSRPSAGKSIVTRNGVPLPGTSGYSSSPVVRSCSSSLGTGPSAKKIRPVACSTAPPVAAETTTNSAAPQP